MKLKDIVPQSKPRNFVVKNQPTSGAGAHKDKKKAEKQGDFKHKKEKIPMEGRHGYDDFGYSLAPGHDEGEPVYSRAHDVAGNYGGSAPRGYSSKYSNKPKGMWFYNVPKGKDLEAKSYGLKQTKSGKWYSKSPNSIAEKEFGQGRYWEPK